MNIAELIEYEKPFLVELKNPRTGEGLGIVFHVVSSDSQRVTKSLRDAQVSYLRDRATKGDNAEFPDMDTIGLAAAVIDWTWGEHVFDHISDGTPATEENVLHVMRHKGAVWIRNQIKLASENIENFTQA